MPRDREAKILAAYKRFGSLKAAAYVVMASPYTVRRVVVKAGLLRKHGGCNRRSLPSLAELQAMRQQLGSTRKVALALGCHPKTVETRLQANALVVP